MKPRFNVKYVVAIVAALAFLVAGLVTWRSRDHGHAAQGAQAGGVWYCPMHPQIQREKPGKCPICGMDLVKREGAAAASPAAKGERKVLFYRNPMNPAIKSDKPMKDDMGMDYVPVYEDEVSGTGPSVPGRGDVSLSPERRQMLGIRSVAVTRQSVGGEVRTVGRVAIDETRIHHQHTKYDGFVERLYVDFVGAPVRRGQALLAVFSPELVASQQEYLVAVRAQRGVGDSSVPGVARSGLGLREAARQRLRRFDMTPAQVRALEETGKPLETVDLFAEMGGVVIEKTAYHGMKVEPGMRLFSIADLSRVWVLADVYEKDLAAMRTGMEAEVTLPYSPGKTWTGRVTFVAPTLEEKTRTAKVRVEIDNPRGELKPDMVADIVLRTASDLALVVPESALIRTGERTLIFVDHGEGRLEPREVQAGGRSGDLVAIHRGVTEGERVVVSANFLLDSESSLRAAISGTPAQGAAP